MTTISAPSRDLQQRMEALQRANKIRSRRAQLKRDIRAGRVKAYDVIVDPPDWAETMKVVHLLLAVPKLGTVKTGEILDRYQISPVKTIGGLSPRQRAEILARLSALGSPRAWAPAVLPVRPVTRTGETPQHLVALGNANKVRLERANLRGSVETLPDLEGLARLAALLLDPPEGMRSASIGDVLTWPHRMGPGRSGRLLRRLAIGPRRPVGVLTLRQRRLIAAWLDAEHPSMERAA